MHGKPPYTSNGVPTQKSTGTVPIQKILTWPNFKIRSGNNAGAKQQKTMKKNDNIIIPPPEHTSNPVIYADLSRGAGLFGIPAQVHLDQRVLADYLETDPALGQNTVGIVLSVLGFQVVAGDALGDSRISVCLARRDSGRTVEVDLAVFRRRHLGAECYWIRFMNEREFGSVRY